MKRIKKCAALMMAAIMALAMSVTAFAANGDSKTIKEQKYKIYQIFTGDYSEGILSNVRWGQNGTGYKAGESTQPLVEETVLNELEAVRGENDTTDGDAADKAQVNVISKYANLGSDPIREGEETSYTGLAPGYYLVSGTVTYENTDPEGESKAETLYVVRVIDGTLTFQPKVDVPTVTKKIVENTDRVDANSASIGADVNYEIIGTMPSNIDAYNEYTYIFNDTLSKGLTFNGDWTVTVNGVNVTESFYKNFETDTTTGVTTIVVGIQNLKALKDTAGEVTADTQVVLTYSAKLNEKAVIGGANPNDVVLKYSNNPNETGSGTPGPGGEPEEPEGVTPKDEVVTYTTELAIIKTDEDNKVLKGAEFTLTGDGVKVSLVTKEEFQEASDGAYWKLKNGSYTLAEPTVDTRDAYDEEAGKFNLVRTIEPANAGQASVAAFVDETTGRVIFTGLGEGTYTLSETKTPAGYNTYADVTFTVSFDKEKKEFSTDNNSISVGATNTLETTIVNQKGSLLPSTGGIGTTIFYVVGAILVIGAGVILVAKKRMSKEI